MCWETEILFTCGCAEVYEIRICEEVSFPELHNRKYHCKDSTNSETQVHRSPRECEYCIKEKAQGVVKEKSKTDHIKEEGEVEIFSEKDEVDNSKVKGKDVVEDEGKVENTEKKGKAAVKDEGKSNNIEKRGKVVVKDEETIDNKEMNGKADNINGKGKVDKVKGKGKACTTA